MATLAPARCVGWNWVVSVEEATRIELVLQASQTLMAPLIVSVQSRQRLVLVGIVLVDVELVVTGRARLGKLIAPLREEAVHSVGNRVVRVRANGLNHVLKVVAMGESRVVVGKRLDPLHREGLDHHGRAGSERVRYQERLECVGEVDPGGRVEDLGVEGAQVVSRSSRAGLRDEAVDRLRGQLFPAQHVLLEIDAERREEVGIFSALFLRSRVDQVDDDGDLWRGKQGTIVISLIMTPRRT